MASSSFYNYSIEGSRKAEFPHLKDAVYVDHAGATLFSKSQIDAVHRDLSTNLYGNPHSHNTSSKLATDTLDQIRYRLLQFFNTSHEEYGLIFTSGCTASLKIIADCFNFGTDGVSSSNSGVFCFMDDSHTSVQGMREVVADRCSGVFCLDDGEVKLAIANQRGQGQGDGVSGKMGKLPQSSSVDPSSSPQSLFAYPAQSNFSGKKYPQEWIKQVQGAGLGLQGRGPAPSEKWFVLLDAAGYVSTSRLDLSEIKPDFVTISFYKIFGYPTGLGALLVHKRAENTLKKKYFGGGTVAMSTAKERFHAFRTNLHDRFEDGTLPFLSIISLRHGLDAVKKLAGGMDKMSEHVFSVAQYFHHSLRDLRHGNGKPLAEIYGDLDFETPKGQGGIVTFNLKRADEKFIGYAEVDKFAQLHDVHLRTGCFCNIGACQRYLNLSSKLIRDNFAAGHVCGDNMDLINGLPTGAVRISFGYMSTIADARACLRFIADSFLERSTTIPQFPDPVWYRKPQSEESEKQKVQNNDDRIRTKDQNRVEKHIVNGDTRVHNETEVTAASVSKTCSETVRKVTDIFLYPVKSCGAFRVSEWEMGSKGLLYDREWILVSDTGVTVGQKREPRICMLTPHINLATRKLTLSFPGATPFELPLDQDEDTDAMASLCTNKVCGDRVNTFDCGDAVSDWLSEIFQMPGMRLLRQQSDDTRKSKLKDKDKVNQQDPEKPKLSMANESQMLLLSRASVRELQKKMVEIVDVDDAEDTKIRTAPADITEDNLVLRFRGNLVVDGGQPFEEEEWTSITAGENTIVCQGQCSRCQMICMDQETGQKSREPLRTLSVWRGKKVPFGVHSRMLPPQDGSRQILRVGDLITVKKVSNDDDRSPTKDQNHVEKHQGNGDTSAHNETEVTAASVSKTCSEAVRKVTDIFLYPVKSCGAFRVSEWEMSSKGLLYDREWILVSDTGVTVGQKREPRICMLTPHIDLATRKLRLSFPGATPFELPLDQDEDFDAMASLCTNKVCGDRVNTFDCGDAVSDWLSEIFQMPGMRLLRQQSDDTRKSKLKDKDKVNQQDSEKPKLSMANESQMLLLSRTSVRELQKKMVEIVDVDDAEDTKIRTAPADITEDNLVSRFRGNLVIDGGQPFEEEEWTSVTAGENTIVCQGQCSRCQMICMDQETGQKSREPLRTLSVWRGKKVPFGVHSRMLPPQDGSKQTLRVGDLVTVKKESS